MCRRELSSGKLPGGIITNGMRNDTCPDYLTNLNWIEFSLIQLVRPVKNMFNLRDIGGRKTGYFCNFLKIYLDINKHKF